MEEKVQPQVSEIPSLTPAQKRKKILLLLLALIGFNAFVFGGLYLVLSKGDSPQKISNVSSSINPTPTPYPFSEMTIPSLRSREYKSVLGEREQVSSNGNYTSFLTSYDSDGFKINGLLTVPAGETPAGGWPAIVFVHGYIPPSVYTTTGNYSSYVDYLARNGFVVFKIDLRGHGQSEGEAGGAYYSSDYVIDVLNAYSALEKYEKVNPKKIGLWGHSMAGNVVSRALGAKPDIPAIAIWGGAVYTYSDFSEFSIEDNSYQPPSEESPSRKKRNEMFEKYGVFDENSEFWKMVPVTNYLDEITGAISLNHAVDDSVVDIGYSRSFNEILDKTDIPHELNEYSSGGHNFTGSSFTQAMNKTIEFYNKYLN